MERRRLPEERHRITGRQRGQAGAEGHNNRKLLQRIMECSEDSETQVQASKRGNAQIIMVTYSVIIVFMCMAGYLIYFMVHDSSEVINNPYNKRRNILAERVVRGSIYSSDGKVLAKTVTGDDGSEKRVYPYNDVFCHVAGRMSNSCLLYTSDAADEL